jgi:GST-like protein
MKVLQLFTARSPAVFKILILLSELGLEFEDHPVNIAAGDQLTSAFEKAGPNGRIPVLIDTDPVGGGTPFSVFESGAILMYLAEKYDQFLPDEPRHRSEVIQWVMWQMAGLGPIMGQARHFRHFALGDQAYAVQRFTNEATRLFNVLDRRLQSREFVGEEYSIADICCWPWLLYAKSNGQDLDAFPDLARWFLAVGNRPAVTRVAAEWWAGIPIEQPQVVSPEARAILFGRTR